MLDVQREHLGFCLGTHRPGWGDHAQRSQPWKGRRGWGSQQGWQEALSLGSLWSGPIFSPSVWGGNVLKGRLSGTVSQAERRGPPPS